MIASEWSESMDRAILALTEAGIEDLQITFTNHSLDYWDDERFEWVQDRLFVENRISPFKWRVLDFDYYRISTCCCGSTSHIQIYDYLNHEWRNYCRICDQPC